MKKILVIFIISMLFVACLCLASAGCKKAEEPEPAPKVEAPVAQPAPATTAVPSPKAAPPPPPAPKSLAEAIRNPVAWQRTIATCSGTYEHVGSGAGSAITIRNQQTAGMNAENYTNFIDDQIKHLESGQILFNPPERMTVGITEIIDVRIAKQINDQFTKGLSGHGVPQIEQIKVGTFMKVHLSGDGFDIKLKSNSEEQIISNEGFTPWEWDVTPQKGGSQTLVLTVTIRLKLPDGKEETKDYPVFRRPIVVAVNPAYTIKTFIMKYWQWLIASLLIPLIGLFFKRK